MRGPVNLQKRLRKKERILILFHTALLQPGIFKFTSLSQREGCTSFTLSAFKKEFEVRIPGRHTVLNCAGCAAASALIYSDIMKQDDKTVSNDFENNNTENLNVNTEKIESEESLSDIKAVLSSRDFY